MVHSRMPLVSAIDLLDIPGKRARRYAARAKIALRGPYWGLELDNIKSGSWVRVLHELEPWSEIWLNWWEEATEIDFLDDGEDDEHDILYETMLEYGQPLLDGSGI